MSIAKKAVDSTIKKILVYTAEIIASFILLVIICLPLAFTIPMWIQNVMFGVPSSDYLISPVAWFGFEGAIGATILLAVPSLIFGYLTIMKMTPGSTFEEKVEENDKEEDEEDEEDESEEIEEVTAEPEEVEEVIDAPEDSDESEED